jgi:hypothetical protein
MAAIQIALARKARVIATAGSKAKRDLLKILDRSVKKRTPLIEMRALDRFDNFIDPPDVRQQSQITVAVTDKFDWRPKRHLETRLVADPQAIGWDDLRLGQPGKPGGKCYVALSP